MASDPAESTEAGRALALEMSKPMSVVLTGERTGDPTTRRRFREEIRLIRGLPEERAEEST